MLYAIAGSQGTGKSTILSELKKLGYNVIERKTARSILEEWQMTLSDIYADTYIMQKFQEELVIRKRKDEKIASSTSNTWFTERTYADLLVYTGIILGPKNENAAWLDEYYNQCQYNQQFYDGIFYIDYQLPNIEHDGVRNTGSVFGKIVNYSMKGYTEFMTDSNKIIFLTEPDVKDRISTILKNIEN